jgi:hypothetical protein
MPTTSTRWVRPPRSSVGTGTAHSKYKTRVGRAEEVEIGGVSGVAERWAKRRFRKDEDHRPLRGPWIELRKHLWRHSGVEVGRLDLGGETWWTVAVPVGDSRPSKASAKLIEAWADLLGAEGQASSYPMWLRACWTEASDEDRAG